MSVNNGRLGSEVPSSSSSDFYNTDAPAVQPNSVLPPTTPSAMEKDEPAATINDPDDDADDEDSSEMDVSASSRASSAEPDVPSAPHAGAKRKLPEASETTMPAGEDDPTKKQKLSHPPANRASRSEAGPARLPVELWQQVFLHLSPAMLCRCLRVSQGFNAALTKTKATPVSKNDHPKVRVLDSEAIWAHARKVFFSNLPRPLVRCTELEMLQLVGGRTCQICTREPLPSPCTSPFNCGPGADGVRVIWPFGIRVCGNCIVDHSLKDVQVLVSSAAALRAGMPYIFLTPDLNFVPEIQRQAPGGIPSHLRVAKVYYEDDIQTISEEYEAAKSLGEGAASEWHKGLALKGKEAMADAARWEKWEAQMQLGSNLSQVLREYDLSSFPKHRAELHGRSTGSTVPQPSTVSNGTHPLPQPVNAYPPGYGWPVVHVPKVAYQQVPRPVRDPLEVEAVRQARKADIERRCMELDPSLEPNVLQHIESFQAAMQIAAPMTDPGWEMLRPRLLAQREAAEWAEHQRREQWAALQATVPITAAEEAFIKPAKELYDKDYEHAQEPLRQKLGEYAEEGMKARWNAASALDKDNSPTFAVEIILYVRQRYLDEKDAGSLLTSDVPIKRENKQGTPVLEPFLSLDNMKWVYDNKIRPLTDNHRRELFICAGCIEEKKPPKWFAFEGLIQHVGAKHTTAFSKGNVVVQWQTSEWPDDPPFHQHPASFIKPHRRTSDYKNHGRSRNTPHGGRDALFAPPASGKLLSENPLFASHAQQPPHPTNGYFNASPGYHAYPHGQGSPPMASYGRPQPVASTADPAFELATQVSKLSSDAREIWDALEGVKELLECVRVQAVIHHVVVRFQDRFHQKPNLDLVTDALANGGENIKPIKNANGLACKICVASQTDGSASYQSYFARIRNQKLFNVSSLITHFKIRHQDQREGLSPDWTTEMIELPETQIISDLMTTPGMDDDKLAVIAAAFKNAFPSPLPRIGVIQEPKQEVGPDSGLASRLLGRLNKKPKQGQVKKKGHSGANGTSTPGREESQEPLPEPKENEYDPRRPMYILSDDRSADPGRFDTDISRRVPSAASSPLGSNTLNLAPETLAALSNLNALALSHKDLSEIGGGERSPSVGRAESLSSLGRPTEGTTHVQPDIAAILASLTGQSQAAQNSTPPTISNRPDSAPKHPLADPYPPPHETIRRTYQIDQRPVTQYAPSSTYRSSIDPSGHYDHQDIRAASSRNIESFDQNRSRTYVETSYPPTQASAHSPPRVRYIYDGGQAYSQPPPPIYREQAPIQQHTQYIKFEPHEHQRSPLATSHYYERPPAPKPVYIDEYGRPVELIPIDSAPAPIQYVPHPIDQQPQPQRPQHYAQPVSATRAQPVYYDYAGHPPPPSAGGGHGSQGMY